MGKNGTMLTKHLGMHVDLEHWKFYLTPAIMVYVYEGETQNIYTITLAWAMVSISFFVLYRHSKQRDLF